MNIRPRLPCDPVLFTSLEQDEAVIRIGHDVFALSLNKNACMLIFPDIERFIRVPILEQVKEFLVVDLQERAVHCVAHATLLLDLRHTHE